MFRSDKIVFNNLMHDITCYGLEGSRNIDITEMLQFFFHILGYGIGNKSEKECYRHSEETISRLLLDKVYEMGKKFDLTIRSTIQELKKNQE